MILAIDIGNSNIVLGCLDQKDIAFVSRVSTDPQKTADQYAVEIRDVLSLYGVDVKNIDGAIVSSVVPPCSHAISNAVEKLTGHQPLLVGPGVKTGLNILIDNPAQLGSDLVAGAVAAINEYPCPIMIIDMGTATTISVVDKDKNMLGGAIIPGVRISLNALSAQAAQLPGISLDPPKSVIGKNTVDSMRSGIVLGNAAMLDGMAQRVAQELGQMPTIVATGGLSRSITPYCTNTVHHDDDLILKGLRIIYYKNKK